MSEVTSQFDRMDQVLAAVWREVRAHRLLRPIRSAGHRIYVYGHTDAVWVGVIPDPQQAGRYLLEARINSPTWWDAEATGETAEGKRRRVVERLAGELRRKWESVTLVAGSIARDQ